VEARVLYYKVGGENTMAGETILYLSDRAATSNSVLTVLEANGYGVVSANSSTQATALLLVVDAVAAIVLNHQPGKETSFDVARNLRAIRPDVLIILLSRDRIERLPPCIDACVRTGQGPEKLASAMRCLLLLRMDLTAANGPVRFGAPRDL
jgi:DNA-binding response OmpR family regulator